MRIISVLTSILALLNVFPAQAELPPLIPRDVLFGNPQRTSPALSPDGTRLAWLAPDTNNVLQVHVETIGKVDDKPVTRDKKRGIRTFFWAYDNRTLLYEQDSDGDENFHLYSADLVSGKVLDRTPFQGVRVDWVCLKPGFPDTLLLSLNLRDRTLFDVYRLNLNTGTLNLDMSNPGDVSGWCADPLMQVRLAQIATADGGTEIRVRTDDKSQWKSFLKVGPEEIVSALDFAADGRSLFLVSSIGRDTTAVVEKNIVTGAEKVIAARDDVDVDDVQIHPRRHVVEAAAFTPARTTWQVIDPTVKRDFAGLAKLHDGDFYVASRTENDDVWLVGYRSDRAADCFYKWDRKTKRGVFLFSSQPEIDNLALAERKPIVIKTRDGLIMNGYLTLPSGVPVRNLPMVLYPHGGPWSRFRWGFASYSEWLANRGYAVLQPNFRGSTGYGKKYLQAGYKQWGLKMHDDLIDAVDWAVKEGIADPKRIGIMGQSYGGYCALAAVTFTPKVFACAVDICGPSNLKSFRNTTPAYWKSLSSLLDARIGNTNDPKDSELIYNASPLNFAQRIVRPLLIGQGVNDARVKPEESEQIVAAIEKNGGTVTYVLYTDEGHDFARPENVCDFNARAEAFLGKYLGGRIEPMPADKIPGSTAVIRSFSAH
jgi:dipeptidyl aminopeptidase/acylaminoacyl peptidase